MALLQRPDILRLPITEHSLYQNNVVTLLVLNEMCREKTLTNYEINDTTLVLNFDLVQLKEPMTAVAFKYYFATIAEKVQLDIHDPKTPDHINITVETLYLFLCLTIMGTASLAPVFSEETLVIDWRKLRALLNVNDLILTHALNTPTAQKLMKWERVNNAATISILVKFDHSVYSQILKRER